MVRPFEVEVVVDHSSRTAGSSSIRVIEGCYVPRGVVEVEKVVQRGLTPLTDRLPVSC